MEIKEAQERYIKARNNEEYITLKYVNELFELGVSHFDISNHYIFQQSKRVIIQWLRKLVKKRRDIHSMVMQNCMLDNDKLLSLLKPIANAKTTTKLQTLDLSNNKIEFNESTAYVIGEVLQKSGSRKGRVIKLQGNTILYPTFFSMVIQSYELLELSLYDCKISSEALIDLSDVLALNKRIYKLDLSYNPEAFEKRAAVQQFGMGVSVNEHLESLYLTGVSTLADSKKLEKLFVCMRNSKTLEFLSLGGIGFETKGINLIRKVLFKSMPLRSLDLQNNGIDTFGFIKLLSSLPVTIHTLDFSYNNIAENQGLKYFAQLLKSSRSLRSVNLSHSLELDRLDEKTVNKLAEAIAVNDSLIQFFCEGAKLGELTEYFCEALNEGIAARRLSLTFKLSSADSYVGSARITPITNRTRTTTTEARASPIKLISNLPTPNSNLSPSFNASNSNLMVEDEEKSVEQTARRDYDPNENDSNCSIQQTPKSKNYIISRLSNRSLNRSF